MRRCERRGGDEGFVTAEAAVVLPVLVILSLTVVAGALGWFLKDDIDTAYVDTEYLDLGR